MSKIVLVRPIPLYEGQKVGAGLKGYEALGLTKAPNTFDKKRLYAKDGKLDTGMLYKVPNERYEPVENPKFKSVKETPKEPEFIPKDPKEPEMIWKWQEMERKLGIKETDPDYNVPPNEEDLSKNHFSKSLAPFSRRWNHHVVRLENGANKFDISVPKDELQVLVLQGTHEVLPTLSEKGNPAYKEANYFFEDVEKEAEIKMTKNESKIKAVEEYSSASTEMKRRYSNILGITKSSSPSDKVVNSTLFDYIDSSESNRKAFLRLVDRYKTSPEYIIAHDEYLQARQSGIIKKKDGKYYKVLPNDQIGQQIGVDDESCVQFLLDIQNNEFRAELKEAVQAYRSRTVNA